MRDCIRKTWGGYQKFSFLVQFPPNELTNQNSLKSPKNKKTFVINLWGLV